MSFRFLLFFFITCANINFVGLGTDKQDFKSTYSKVEGIIQKFCSDCHNPDKKKGSLDFSSFDSFESIYRNRRVWNNVIEQVMNGEMPPRKKAQPNEIQKKQLISWIETYTQDIDCSNIHDPGHVVIRRLNRSEYDNTVRDLTGLNLKLAQSFPVQGGGGEGFDNNSEVMFFPAIYMEKYLEAAKTLSNHMQIHYQNGVSFSSEISDAKNPSQYYTEQQFNYNAFFSEWRSKQPKIDWKKEFQAYSKAAMQLIIQHPDSKHYDQTMLTFSQQHKVKVAYLEKFRDYLANKNHENPWAKWSVEQWYDIFLKDPKPKTIDYDKISKDFTDKNIFIHHSRNPRSLSREIKLPLKGKPKLYLSFGDAGDGHEHDIAVVHHARILLNDGKSVPLIDCKLLEHRGEGEVTFNTRPNQQPIKLNAHGQKIIDGLELKAPALLVFELPENAKEYRGFFGVSDLGSGKAMLQAEASTDVLTYPMPWKPQGVLLCGPGPKLSEQSPHISWIDNYISKKIFNANDAAIKKLLTEEEKNQHDELKRELDLAWRNKSAKSDKKQLHQIILAHLKTFTEKAYRKPLSNSEFEPLQQIYLKAMNNEDNFQKASRQVIQKIFISPDFLYRFEQNHPGKEPQPVTDIELANRLSYFIWSSMPDEQLMQIAKSGQLHNDEVLKREVLRMLKDPKAFALTEEFASQWLGLRQLKGERRPNAETFKYYNNQIRDALIREATLVFHDMVLNNSSILDLLSSPYTYINEPLANYYQIPNIQGEQFQKVNVSSHGRGGLFGLGAIHVTTSYPDRTSPVLRGLWILETLLGNPTPPPPEDVEIDEAKMADPNLTIKQRFAAHRENPSCAICHDRIDPIGFTLEGFDATGKLRTHEGQHPIDNLGELKNNIKIKGPQGLKKYILEEKRDEYLHHFTAKLLGFALGRSLDYYDDCVIESIMEKTHHQNYRFNDLVVELVKTLPFRFRRGMESTAYAHPQK